MVTGRSLLESASVALGVVDGSWLIGTSAPRLTLTAADPRPIPWALLLFAAAVLAWPRGAAAARVAARWPRVGGARRALPVLPDGGGLSSAVAVLTSDRALPVVTGAVAAVPGWLVLGPGGAVAAKRVGCPGGRPCAFRRRIPD